MIPINKILTMTSHLPIWILQTFNNHFPSLENTIFCLKVSYLDDLLTLFY